MSFIHFAGIRAKNKKDEETCSYILFFCFVLFFFCGNPCGKIKLFLGENARTLAQFEYTVTLKFFQGPRVLLPLEGSVLIFTTALQLIEYPFGDGIEVIFAGGRRELIPNNETDPEYPDLKGERLDGRNLIQEWVDKFPNSQYVWNKTGFDHIDVSKVDHVMGRLS